MPAAMKIARTTHTAEELRVATLTDPSGSAPTAARRPVACCGAVAITTLYRVGA